VVGVRVIISGRLNGADMARKEEIKRGRIPLQTFRANIDYAQQEARLPYGAIGVKVWVYLGEQFGMDNMNDKAAAQPTPATRAPSGGERSRA
jgi:small subunit ribosomal protein S3